MKKVLLFVCLSALFFIPLSINAQQNPQRGVCGLAGQEAAAVRSSMFELRERYPNVAPLRAVAYVPVWFHLVAKADGTGRLGMNKLLDMVCEWNRLYAVNNMEMQFYIKGINNIDNAALYDNPRSFAGSLAINSNKKGDGMNVFMLNSANDPAQPNAKILGYYDPSSDIFIVRNDEATIGGAATIAHEAGHYFSLSHPFYGWETCPFKPTADVPCAPATVGCFGGGTYSVENVARSGIDKNCANAADGLCDTRPSYNLGFDFSGSNCNYVGLACDPKGVKIDPDESNIMDYFTGCALTFTAEQKAAVQRNYIQLASRAALRAGNIAPTITTLGTTTLVSPAAGATTTNFNNFTLNWDAVAGATGYIVELAKVPTFADLRVMVATTNALNVNSTLLPGYLVASGQNYFWRVKAFNSYVHCAAVTVRSNFVSGTLNATNEIAGVSSFDVSPNPLSKTQPLNLNLTTETAFEARVKLYNIAGQLIRTEKHSFNVGFSTQAMSVSDLSTGLYMLSIESEKGVLNKKVVITQ